MKIFNKTMQILIAFFIILSIVSIIYSFIGISHSYFCLNKDCFDTLIKSLTEYQMVYIALLGLITLYFGFFQIEILIRQNEKKRTIETLNQVSNFYIEVQNNIKEFYLSIEKEEYNFFKKEFKINDFTDQDLAEQDVNWCNKYSNFENILLNKNRVTLMLARIESFSNYVLYGNIDMDLFRELLGKEYKRQIEILYPFISTYRNREKSDKYYSGIVSLYEKLE